MTHKGRKWTLALWGMGLGTAVVAAALAGWFQGLQGAGGILAQGLGIVTGTYALYSAANVTQKATAKQQQ